MTYTKGRFEHLLLQATQLQTFILCLFGVYNDRASTLRKPQSLTFHQLWTVVFMAYIAAFFKCLSVFYLSVVLTILKLWGDLGTRLDPIYPLQGNIGVISWS